MKNEFKFHFRFTIHVFSFRRPAKLSTALDSFKLKKVHFGSRRFSNLRMVVCINLLSFHVVILRKMVYGCKKRVAINQYTNTIEDHVSTILRITLGAENKDYAKKTHHVSQHLTLAVFYEQLNLLITHSILIVVFC